LTIRKVALSTLSAGSGAAMVRPPWAVNGVDASNATMPSLALP
jgi:hypothetical protein